MKKTESTAGGGGDRISGLPDEILHLVLRRLDSSPQAAQTAVLSRRWLSVWRSYPVVEFDQGHFRRLRSEKYNAAMAKRDLEEFGNATIGKFSRNSRLRIETLWLSLEIIGHGVRFPVVEQLLDLASERKAEEVAVGSWGFIGLPIQFLSNPTVKALYLYSISLMMNKDVGTDVDDLPLHLNSLRTLNLDMVKFENEGIFANLIASSPLLERLKIGNILTLEKLSVSDVSKLRTLEIELCRGLEEIEIAAPQLQTLRISGLNAVSKFELVAPRLSVLKIENSDHCSDQLRIEDLVGAISKLESLRFLTLKGFDKSKKLKLSSPKLERFELWAPAGLEEIDLDVNPGNLQKFSLHYSPRMLPSFLGRCEIDGSSLAPNGWEVHFGRVNCVRRIFEHKWFVGLKDFIDRFTHFETVNILRYVAEAAFNKEEVDYTVYPTTIQHLKIKQHSLLYRVQDKQKHHRLTVKDEQAFRDGLFWACSPRFLTILHESSLCDEGLLNYFLNLASHSSLKHSAEKDGMKCSDWENRLKDVRIESKETKMETADEWCGQVCFRLTWY